MCNAIHIILIAFILLRFTVEANNFTNHFEFDLIYQSMENIKIMQLTENISLTTNITTQNNNIQEAKNIYFARYIAITIFLCFLLPYGFALLYSGFGYSGDFVSIVATTILTTSIITLLWGTLGFTLAFGNSQNGFIGDMKYAVYLGINMTSIPEFHSENVPGILFVFYSCLVACIPTTILIGSIIKKFKYFSFLFFIFLWTIIVLAPVTHWVWNSNGFLNVLGVIDQSGGLVINTTSGFSSLAITILSDKYYKKQFNVSGPKNTSTMLLLIAICFIWIGYLGLSSGFLNHNEAEIIHSLINTIFAGCTGSIVFLIFSYIKYNKPKIQLICVGIICGINSVNSGSGFIPIYGVLVITIFSSSLVIVFSEIRQHNQCYSDNLEVFTLNGLSGIIGELGTGIFSSKDIRGISGGIDGNWYLLAYQVAGIICVALWSFIWSLLLFIVIYYTKILQFQDSNDFLGYGILIHKNEIDLVIEDLIEKEEMLDVSGSSNKDEEDKNDEG